MRPRRVRCLLVERLPIPNAALHELRPGGNHRKRVGLFWPEPPQSRMVPTQGMSATVTMLTNAVAQLLDFGNELFPGHLVKVCVHIVSPAGEHISDAHPLHPSH